MTALPPLRRVLLVLVLLCFVVGFLFGSLAWDAAAALVALIVLADVLRGLRRGVAGVDVIALLAITGALALREHLAAVIIALMVAGGSALEEFAQARARRELAALMGPPLGLPIGRRPTASSMCRSKPCSQTTCC